MTQDRQTFLQKSAEIGLSITPTQQEQLDAYANLLLKWTSTHNLIAKSTENEIYYRHILDCAQLTPHIPPRTRVLDIGSGAGLPAVILAILTNAHIYACEINSKKASFLKTARRVLNLQSNFQIYDTDIAQLPQPEPFDIITSRAFAEISLILKIGMPYLKPKSQFLLLKGENYQDELTRASDFSVTATAKPSITSKGGVILALSSRFT